MYRILLVDDEILVRDAIKENIDWKAIDCELVGDCENGKQAAEFVKEHPVDIVLTDILMPYMDGMELSHFLHDNYPDIVIVIFSGFGEFEYAKKAIQYGVSEYLLKPVTAMELTGVIEKMKKKVDQLRIEKYKMDRLTKTSEKYHKNEQIIRSKNMEALVNCTTDVNKSIQRLAEMGIDISAISYRVALFDIDLYSGMYQLDTEKRQESALMAFVLFNISDEIVTREDAGIAYQEGNNRVCVLFQEKWSRNFTARTKEICREIQEKTKEVMGFDVSMGIGKWVKNPEELIQSHDMAEQTLQYRYLLGGNLLIDMEEQHPAQEIGLDESLAELKEGMKTGQKAQVDQILATIEESIRHALMEKSRACMYLQQVIRTMDNACEDVSANMDEVREDRDELLRQVTEQKSFEDACKVVQKHMDRVFGILSEMNTSSSERQARLAIDYIQKNYMDPDLSLNSICSYLNISTSYFSTIFKDETGETFTEVLIRTRMEKAKELLENTTMKNYEIAEKVGFSDPHYFGISFKKMTGCTPTEYAREKRR
ncbi:response regulator [Blautia sp. MSJ-19]|uniref:response regulator n=1 Tax=Blautia sp. MSJ-19 TaxID=2841517 RepID=UPI001C0EAEE6|nr:response regulator [Blautia sp. MSJ-19]MBU5480550.1 response regulator [Blautia sp. MSJ-19]